MKTKEWATADKSGWGPGPWQGEPDKVQWVDPDTGLDCLIVRNSGGALCGYVGVPEGHQCHGQDYMDLHVHVHGGLTFAAGCDEPTEEEWRALPSRLADPGLQRAAARHPKGDAGRQLASLREQAAMPLEEWVAHRQARRICHVPEPGRPKDVWWLGFDCAHAGDLVPGWHERHGAFHGVYRDRRYVEGQVRELARQLSEETPHG